MLYQVTAYEVLDRLVIQVVTAESNADRMEWTRYVLEDVPVSDKLAGEPWDMIWLIGQVLQERALSRGSGTLPPF